MRHFQFVASAVFACAVFHSVAMGAEPVVPPPTNNETPALNVTVTDVKQLFDAALVAPTGKIHATLEGPMLKAIQGKLGTNSRVYADVKVIGMMKQPGCKRLEVLFSAPQLMLKTAGGEAPLQGVGFRVGICKNGRPPDPAAN